jgi:transposase
MIAIEITREDLSATELRQASAKAKGAAAARRMLALALVLEGADRTTAAESCGMDRQTLRDWVRRYNAEGLAGLANRKLSGRPPKLTAAQKEKVAALVEAGPDPETDKVVRWRRVDLRDKLEELFGVTMHDRSVGKQLAALGYRKLSVRPQHPNADPEAQEPSKKTLPGRSPKSSRNTPEASRSKSGSRTRRASVSRGR